MHLSKGFISKDSWLLFHVACAFMVCTAVVFEFSSSNL